MVQESSPTAGRSRIAGIYELGHVLYALDADSHGFSAGGIDRVECFWTLGDMHSSSAGFVLGLGDGRRAYVELQHTHAFEQVEDLRIEVAFLPREQAQPSFSSPLARIDWSFDIAHLNRVLARRQKAEVSSQSSKA